MDIKVASTFTSQRDKIVSLFETDLNCNFFRKFAYENIQRDTTRLYFDIDLKNHCNGPQIEKEIVKQLDYQKESMEFVYTNGSTPTKVSFHIISTTQTIQKKTFRKEMAKDWLRCLFTEDSKENSTDTLPFSELFNAVDNAVYKNQKYMRLPYGVCSVKKSPHIPNDIEDMKSYFITYVTDDMKPFNCEPVPEIQLMTYKGNVDNGEMDPINIKKYKKNLMTLLERIDKKRFKMYSYWLELLFLMKGRGLEENDFIQFSKDSEYETFNETKCRDDWYRCDAKPMIGLTRVIEWCKEDGIDFMPLIYTEKEIKDKKKKQLHFDEQRREVESNKIFDEAYKKMKEEFELTNAKINLTSEFVTKIGKDIVFKSKVNMMTTYEQLEYPGLDENKKFIGRWIKDCEMKTFDKVDSIPHTLPQNPRIFNIWKNYPEHTSNECSGDIQPFLNHMDIISGHEKIVTDFVILWLAHLLQRPEEKIGKMLNFAGVEGCGKGLFLETIKELIGYYNVFDTTSVDSVCGQFNGIIANKLLICLNELEFKHINPADGKLKGLVTDPRIFINEKNQTGYDMASYHRFISFTNNLHLPIQTSANDRRKCIIMCADDIVGNLQYGQKYMDYLKDNIGCIYYYLIGLDVSKFKQTHMPVTQYQKDVQELFTNPVELWLKHLGNTLEQEVCSLTGVESLDSYNSFRKQVGINLELSSQGLSMRLKNTVCVGVSDVKKTMTGNKRIYTRSLIRSHFKMDDDLDE